MFHEAGSSYILSKPGLSSKLQHLIFGSVVLGGRQRKVKEAGMFSDAAAVSEHRVMFFVVGQREAADQR